MGWAFKKGLYSQMPSYQMFPWLKWKNSKQRVFLENSFKYFIIFFKQRNYILIGSLGVLRPTPNAKRILSRIILHSGYNFLEEKCN